MRGRRRRYLTRRARLAVVVALLGATVATTSQPIAAASTTLKPTGCVWSLGYLPPVSEVMDGTMQLPGGPSVDIGTGAIDWNIATKYGEAWAKNFMSLSWILSPVHLYYIRDGASYMLPYLQRAEQIAADFAAHIPVGGGPEPQATWSAMYAGQRADVFGCLASLDPSFAPAFRELRAMGPWLANPAHDPGSWNQGVDFRLGGLAAGCVTGNATWATLARDKLGSLAATVIDAQGAPIEQSIHYGARLVTVFSDAATQVGNCFGTAPSIIGSRLRALKGFLSWASAPGGGYPSLGDSDAQTSPTPCPAPAVVATAQSATSKVYAAGYAFGRSNSPQWGYYSLRFGPGRALHGHNDHESITWTARGSSLLVDPGYRTNRAVFAAFGRSPEAHNVLTEPGVAFAAGAATTLIRSRLRTAWQSYELTDTAYGGRARVRDVLVDLTAGIVVVEDRASRARSGAFTQLWHLPLDDAVSVSRTGVASASMCGATTTWITPLPLRGQTVALHSTGVVKGQTSPYQGWTMTSTDAAPAPVIVVRRSGTIARMVTVLTVGSRYTQPRISRTWSATGGYVYTISNAGVVRHVRLDNSGLFTEI